MSESKSTVAQVQPGREQENSLDAAGFVNAALSPSGKAWRKWFEQVGEHATVDVVNATANLVIAERKIFATPAPVPVEQRAGMIQCNQCHHWWVKFEWQTGPTSYCRVPNCNCKCTSLVGPDENAVTVAGTGTEELLPPERVRVVIRAATSDDWVGVAYYRDYKGDPSTIHEYVHATHSPSGDVEKQARKAFEDIAHLARERVNVPASEVYTLLEHIDRRASVALAELSARSEQLDDKGDRE